MPNWLIVSIVGSVVLTVLLNLLPMLFPKTARRAQERMIEEIHKQHDWEDDAARPGPDLLGTISTSNHLSAALWLVDVACCRWNSTGVMYCRLECGRTSL